MDPQGEKITLVGVLDEEGYAICPDCLTRVHCGPVGIANLEKRHRGYKICKETKARRDKEAKKKKDGSLLTFFGKHQKATPIPSTVKPSAPVRGHNLSTFAGQADLVASSPKKTVVHPLEPVAEPPINDFLWKLYNLVENLPASIPEASDYDSLAVFSGNPADYDDPSLSADELWETTLNGLFKSALGWGTEGNMDNIIRRGQKGLDGLTNFIKHFVVKRGVSMGLFEGKLTHLMDKLEEKSQVSSAQSANVSGTMPMQVSKPATIDPESTRTTPVSIVQRLEKLEIPLAMYQDAEVIDVDMFEFEDTLKRSKPSVNLCEGYSLAFPDGQSPHNSYPFALHNQLELPWDYSVRNGRMTLFARSCTQLVKDGVDSCSACQNLYKNKTLEGMLTRLEEGVNENLAFSYHSFRGLIEMLHRKNHQIQFYRLRGLNQARKLLSRTTALSDQKRLLMAIASGKANRVDRLIAIGLAQKKGARGLLEAYLEAGTGVYKPKTFTEEEDMKNLLIWRLSGNRVAHINHRANGAQSVSYLRSRSTVPLLIPSHAQPTVEQVQKNLEATLGGVLDVLHSRVQSGVIHAVMMFDELATEKRVRWDPKTNYFLGVCRQHAHKTSTEFVNEGDLEELYQNLDDGVVHYAAEATVAALGLLCKDNRIYPARPVLVSGDCKRESGQEHAEVLKNVLKGVDTLKEKTKIRVISIASDGETRRGSAFIQLTFKHKLSMESPIYALLQPLCFLNLFVGDDDLTCDKDYKHVFKRFRNLFVRPRGVTLNHRRITPDTMTNQFKSEGLSADHIRSLFNPDDKQDVKMALDMLKDIWGLPRVSDSTDSNRGFLENREALWILGKFLFHLVFPYICIDLSLSEQIEHLSAASHLAFALFKQAGKQFIPTGLYIDMMIMVKNVIFCIAKAKIDDPDGEFFPIQLGTDRLEELFGILRTMVGNDANVDMLQLVSRLAGTTEVANILARYPHWDSSPRRLKFNALTRESKEIPDSADHIKPPSWRGNAKLKEVSLQTSWNRGRRLVEDECEFVKPILEELEYAGADMLSPSGTLLFDLADDPDDIDESLEDASDEPDMAPTSSEDVEIRVEVEDSLGELADDAGEPTGRIFDKKITINGLEMSKARALSKYGRTRKFVSSTDRLKRVQEVGRYGTTADKSNAIYETPTNEGEVLLITDPVATVIYSENQFWFCIGEVNGLKIDGKAVGYISLEILLEDTVTVSYQMLGLRPATSDDDPGLKHDWRTHSMREQTFSVPGKLVQSIDPALSVTHKTMPFYLFESTVIVALTASIFQSLSISDLKMVPKFAMTNEYPYRATSGYACFVCETDEDLGEIGGQKTIECPRCSPTVILDLSQGQRVLEHIGAHILHDPGVIHAKGILCGLCLRPSPLCQYFLMKGKGANGNVRVNSVTSKGCLVKMNYSYRVAAESSASSPCSNVPIQCPICSKSDPAVWKYFMKMHFEEKHKNLRPFTKYEHLWKLFDFEMSEMKKIWEKRLKVTAKRTKKSNIPPLVISDVHRARIPSRFLISISFTSHKVAYHSRDRRNDSADLSEDIYEDSEQRDVSELVPDDNESFVDDLPVDGPGELQEVYKRRIVEQKDEGIAIVVEGEGKGGDGIIVQVSGAPVRSPEDRADSAEESVREPLSTGDSQNDTPVLQERTASSVPVLGRATPMLDRNSDSESPPTSSIITTEAEFELNELPQKRRRIRRNIELNGCFCGSVLDSSAAGVIECKRTGCETQWYHRECVTDDPISRNWVCEACKVSGDGRGNKRSRR